MKIFKIMMMALVAMCGLNSCSDDCNHDYIEVDYSKKLAGTWTSIDAENEFAEALIFNTDGTVTSTGVFEGAFYEKKGTFKIKDNKITLSFEDGDGMESRFEMVEGKIFSMVDDELDVHFNYNYCENDFSDEIVGMWVCMQEAFGQEEEIVIQTYDKNGINIFTGYVPEANGYIKEAKCKYKVIGDLLITSIGDSDSYVGIGINIIPNATEYGDIMSTYNPVLKTTSNFLRVKQNLNLAGKAYDYSATYISNAKGADKDIAFLDTKFNFAHMDGSIIDKFLKSVLYNVQFPDAKTFQYNCLLEGQNVSLQLPMEVEGNKITIKMSSRHEAYRDVVVYAFQDVDGCQFHMYMPTASFENFFSNLSLSILSASGQVDINNPVHVDAVYKEVADAIESINVSIVMK